MANMLTRIARKIKEPGSRTVLSKKDKAIIDNATGNQKMLESFGEMTHAERFYAEMIKYDKDGLPSSFSAKGKAVLAGAVGVSSTVGMYQENRRQNMGRTDGQIYTNTPNFQSYLKMKPQRSPFDTPAGADGSLVFALNNVRQGGFL